MSLQKKAFIIGKAPLKLLNISQQNVIKNWISRHLINILGSRDTGILYVLTYKVLLFHLLVLVFFKSIFMPGVTLYLCYDPRMHFLQFSVMFKSP